MTKLAEELEVLEQSVAQLEQMQSPRGFEAWWNCEVDQLRASDTDGDGGIGYGELQEHIRFAFGCSAKEADEIEVRFRSVLNDENHEYEETLVA